MICTYSVGYAPAARVEHGEVEYIGGRLHARSKYMLHAAVQYVWPWLAFGSPMGVQYCLVMVEWKPV